MYKFFFIISILVFTHLSTSCSNSPDYHIDTKKFTLILADMMIIDAYVIPDSVKAAKLDSVFKVYNTNPADFNAFRINYQQEPDFWRQIYQDAENILKEHRTQTLKSSDNQKQPPGH